MATPSERPTKRRYDNKLRASRKQQTRELILDALAEELSDGSLNELSVGRIAKRAGVSEPTVYRHFPNRSAMFDGLQTHVAERMALPEKWEGERDLAEVTQELFAAFERERELMRAMMVARLGQQWGAEMRQQRTERLAPAFERLVEGLPDKEARGAVAVLRYLQSARTWKAFDDEHGMTGAESAEAVTWAMRTLLAEIERMKERRADDGGEEG